MSARPTFPRRLWSLVLAALALALTILLALTSFPRNEGPVNSFFTSAPGSPNADASSGLKVSAALDALATGDTTSFSQGKTESTLQETGLGKDESQGQDSSSPEGITGDTLEGRFLNGGKTSIPEKKSRSPLQGKRGQKQEPKQEEPESPKTTTKPRGAVGGEEKHKGSEEAMESDDLDGQAHSGEDGDPYSPEGGDEDPPEGVERLKAGLPSTLEADSGETCLPDQVRPLKKLKVYVYDLPRKLNFGMFSRKSDKEANESRSRHLERADVDLDMKPWGTLESEKGVAPPDWPWSGKTHPTAKQHSMEYFIVADLLLPPAMRNANTTATRVLDPKEADVFLVPVFASLLVNLYRRRNFDIYEKRAQELAEFLSKSPWWKRSGGRDHVIPVHHPCALETVRDWMSGAIFVVVDFARFHPATANPVKDLVHPYNQLVMPYSQADEEKAASEKGASIFDARTTLAYFQGSVAGRPKRKAIVEALQGDPNVHVRDVKASTDSIKETQAGMRASRFCLHIVGDTPSASRLFNAIVSGCIPVVISDSLDLPFESSVNYAHFTLFFREQAALEKGHVVEMLRSIGTEQWTRMWTQLQRVQHHFFFQVPSQPGDAVDMMWKQVQEKLPWIHLSRNRDRRLTIPDWWDHEDTSDKVLRRRQANRKKRAKPVKKDRKAAKT